MKLMELIAAMLRRKRPQADPSLVQQGYYVTPTGRVPRFRINWRLRERNCYAPWGRSPQGGKEMI